MMANNENNNREVIYGSGPGSTGGGADESRVMSERVQHLAASIYKEFEKMIQKYDEDSVKELMPLVVNVLESLDLAYLEKEEHEVELELLKEDNEQLVTQYEREKQLRRGTEQRLLEFEDNFESEQKDLQDKIDSLESIVRMLELKSKNSSDHVGRLEERETELKQEYSKLHERYTELFKTHMDYMERTKFLMGNDKFDVINAAPTGSVTSGGPRPKFAYSLSEHGAVGMRQVADLSFVSGRVTAPSNDVPTNLSNEMQDWPDDVFSGGEQGEPSSREMTPRNVSKETPMTEVSADDSLGADLTGGLVDPAEFASADRQYSVDSSSDKTSDSDGDDMVDHNSNLGMGKEVENLIKENTELLETKNALNIVKNDLIAKVDELSSEQEILREEVRSLEMVRAKLNERIKELETEIKDLKQQLEDVAKNKDEEEDIPMAQRKRFTRVEMARVLMERNQYKEKLMELQEAVRWTEMIRASRNDPSLKRKKSSIWDFFSSLFSGSGGPAAQGTSQDVQTVNVRYSGSTKQVLPGTDPLVRKKAEKPKAFDFLDAEYSSEKRAAERKEQYKLVKAHVKKDESGRLQAYGWSIPAIDNNQGSVPVPVYCRPLMDQEPNLRIWCATGILLTGGRTKDGGEIVGGSVFYTSPAEEQQKISSTDQPIESLDNELKAQVKEYHEFWNNSWASSSLMWICSSAHGESQVAVIDANNPSDVLESFSVCSSHLLCIESIPGVRDSDYAVLQEYNEVCRPGNEMTEAEPGVLVGEVRYVVMTASDDGTTFSGPVMSPKKEPSTGNGGDPQTVRNVSATVTPSEKAEEILKQSTETDQSIRQKSPPKVRLTDQLPEHIKDGLSKYSGISDITTALPTVWMGSQNGYLYIHSAVSEWRKCLRRIKLDDAILSVVHYKGRIFAALANGTVVVLQRNSTGEWSTDGYHVVVLGKPHHSVRCLTVVAGNIWCGYKNLTFILNPLSLKIEHCFSVHPRKESQVRQLLWVGDGVWCSIRLDSTLRLYNAHTYQHLQDVDIEPYVSQMLGTSKLGFSFVRITALLVSSKRLWIGTGNGVILSVPLTENIDSLTSGNKQSVETGKKPGGVVRVYADASANSDRVKTGSFIPYSNMAQAQLSFHGHKDAVKFFVAVPGSVKTLTTTKVVSTTESDTPPKMNDPLLHPSNVQKRKLMVVSGGDGYIDFRMGDEDEDENRGTTRRDLSHLIVWEVQCDVAE